MANRDRRRRRRGVAIAVAMVAGTLAIGADANEGPRVQQWIEALRPLPAAMVAASPAALPARPPATAVITFDSGTATLTAATTEELDALADALSTAALHAYSFELQWYADPKARADKAQSLPDRRASALYEYLQQRPELSPARLMLRPVRRKPVGLEGDLAPNTLAIRVVNRGLP